MGHFGWVIVIDLSSSELVLAHGTGCHSDKQLHPQITAIIPPGMDQGLVFIHSLFTSTDLGPDTVSLGLYRPRPGANLICWPLIQTHANLRVQNLLLQLHYTENLFNNHSISEPSPSPKKIYCINYQKKKGAELTATGCFVFLLNFLNFQFIGYKLTCKHVSLLKTSLSG